MTRLTKIVSKSKKRLGRGYGSGKGGHTSGRGQKGQKTRGKMGVTFEGMKMKKSFIKRLPFKRGKGKFKAKTGPIIVNLGVLDLLPSGTVVNVNELIKHGLVDKKDALFYGVKILGSGQLSKKLTIELPISHSASTKVKKAGGKVTFEADKTHSS